MFFFASFFSPCVYGRRRVRSPLGHIIQLGVREGRDVGGEKIHDSLVRAKASLFFFALSFPCVNGRERVTSSLGQHNLACG